MRSSQRIILYVNTASLLKIAKNDKNSWIFCFYSTFVLYYHLNLPFVSNGLQAAGERLKPIAPRLPAISPIPLNRLMTNYQSGGAALLHPKRVLPFDMAPHPCNLAFCKAMTSTLIKALGVSLSQVASGKEFQSIALEIRQFFADHFGSSELPSMQPHHHHETPDVTPEQFTVRLVMLNLPSPNVPCAVARNLDWLCLALHLSSIEKKILLWSYCGHRSTPSVLPGILNKIPCCDAQQVWHALGLFFNEPADAVAQTLAEPCRLHGMGLVDLSHRGNVFSLNRYLTPTPTLKDALEIPHRSIDGLLSRCLEPEASLLFDPESEMPPDIAHAMFPEPVALAYETAMAKQPLKAAHIAALISWFSQYRITEESCTPLEGFLDYFSVQLAVRRCFIKNSRNKLPVTPLAILQAVYAVAE